MDIREPGDNKDFDQDDFAEGLSDLSSGETLPMLEPVVEGNLQDFPVSEVMRLPEANMPRQSSNEVLQTFIAKRGTRKRVKVEYLRCKFIRGHKKVNRLIGKGRIPTDKMNKLCFGNKAASKQWSKLCKIYDTYSDTLKEQSQTQAGPLTDGKNKRLGANRMTECKSFNNRFCTEYFSSKGVLKSFQVYIDYLFVGESANGCCDRFSTFCCECNSHDDECRLKWEGMREYLKTGMIGALGVELTPMDH